ncbi:MAG: ABC transporter permease [Methanotrichaceae archaeon]|nr:ABC transporter permease [Methanotrichaceae archaeon]
MFELTIAKKHITSDPRMVLFAVLSVSLAIGVIVVMMGLMEGYREQIVSSTVENNPHLIIGPKEDEEYISLYRSLSGIVRDYPQVTAVSPRLLGQAGAKYKDKVRGVSFIGADPLLEDPLMRVEEDMVQGNYYDLVYKKRAAVLGTRLAEELELKMGDRFTLVRQNESHRLEVVGLIQTGTGSDQNLVYLPLETAQELMGQGDVVSEIGVRLLDIYAAPAIVLDLNSNYSYEATSWQDQSRDILEVLDTQRVILYIFYTLIFVISGFGVANTMIMAVTRRTKEIGILMAMGARRWSVVKIFLAESLILGPPAALLGCLLAYGTAKLIEAYPIEVPSEVYMVSRMNVLLTPQMFVYAVVFALAINFVAGIYPAWKASRLDPVEAIGSE